MGFSRQEYWSWGAISFFRGSFQSRNQTWVSWTGRQVAYCWASLGNPYISTATHLFCNQKFVPLNLPQLSLSSAHLPCFGNHLLVLCVYNSASVLLCLVICFLDSTYKKDHTIFVFLCLPYFTWQNIPKILPYCGKCQVFILFYGWVIFHHKHIHTHHERSLSIHLLKTTWVASLTWLL